MFIHVNERELLSEYLFMKRHKIFETRIINQQLLGAETLGMCSPNRMRHRTQSLPLSQAALRSATCKL